MSENAKTQETDICEICGKKLVSKVQDADKKKCYYCGQEYEAHVFCPEGHFICDSCHSKSALEVIEEYCAKTELKDPFQIAENIMHHPKFKMYGPEHHVLVPAVILTALKNNGCLNPNQESVNFKDIKEAITRSSKIPGGWCGFYGSCGAGIGSGVSISVFSKATPSTHKTRSSANRATSNSLKKISDNLEHCCKRSVRLAIESALEVLKEDFGINLDYKHGHCSFSKKNEKCSGKDCPIF